MTCASSDLAICTPSDPTPPEAPITSTVWPGWTFPSHGPKGGDAGDRKGRCLLEAEPGRLQDELVRPGGRELGERALLGGTHHAVAVLEAGDVRADRLDRARDVPASDGDPRSADPDRDAGHVRHAGHHVPHVGTTPCGVHPHEHVVVADHGFLDVSELQHVRRAVAILHDRLHTVIATLPRPRPSTTYWIASGASASGKVRSMIR